MVVLAGYKNRIDEFFRANPGMSSRIAHHRHFPAYKRGTVLHGLEPLALVQLLVLYHLVTAKSSKALGAPPARAATPA